MSKIYVGQVGVKVELDTEDDLLAAATDIEIRCQKPDGTEVEFDATRVGTVAYFVTTDEEDFDQSGDWLFQVYAEKNNIWKMLGETFSLTIYRPYT